MANEHDTTGSFPVPTNPEDFAAAIGKAVAVGLAEHSPKKVTFGEYQRRMNKGRLKLKRESYENGVRCNPIVLSNTEIDLLNRITHSGRYLNRKVEVIVREDGADPVVELRWNCKSSDQRNDIKGEGRNFQDILQQVVDAQKIEREEEEEKQHEKSTRPKFGAKGQAYQDAKSVGA